MLPVSQFSLYLFRCPKEGAVRGEEERRRAGLGTVHEHAGGNVRINIAYRCVISDVFCLNKIMKLTGGKCRAGRREREVGSWGGGAPANCAAIRYRFRIN